jgi:N-ethylmaleimide reductase
MTSLFTPLQAGDLLLPNRILMAPLTRCRAEDDHVPGALIAEYYAQRASAGLIIAEATMAMPNQSSFWREPGIHSEAQVAGWNRATDAVHAAGGRIVLQLWHGGRACHPDLNDGAQPIAPSALRIENDQVYTPKGKVDYVLPRALDDAELPGIVEGFAHAARNAKAAGFDGVEVHGANGYLLDEFLRDGSNRRSGPYGGDIANRARLLLEVLESVCGVWGSHRVGLRVSPLNSYNDMRDSDPIGLVRWLGKRLNDFDLAYWHVMRGDFLGQQSGDVMTPARERFDGVLIGNMGYDAAEAEAAIAAGKLDAVAFGKPFIANPDLPERIRDGLPLAEPDQATFYTWDAKGYTDYPRYAAP